MAAKKAVEPVLEFLKSSSRPFGVNDINEHLNNQYGKTAVIKALEFLVEKKDVVEKINKKSKIYFYNQSLLPLDEDELAKIEAEIGSSNGEIRRLEAEIGAMETECLGLSGGTMSLPEIETKLEKVEEAVNLLENEMKALKKLDVDSGKKKAKVISAEEVEQLKKRKVRYMTEWRKRKRMAMDMIDGVLEEYPKTKKALLEDIGVETDEMVGVSLLRRFFLGHRRNMLFLFACALLAFVNPGFADRELKCLVCRSLAEELKDEIAKADPKKKIDVGTGRLSSNGDVKTNVVPYLRSTVHMLDLLENVCSVFDDYIEGTYRDTNERAVVKIMINGAMNPDFSRVEPKLKSDLNKGLKFYCETIVEEFDEAIIRIYGKVNETADEARELCTDEARFCDQDGNDVDQDSEEKDEL